MTNEEIAKALAEIDSRCKSNTHRLDKQEQRQAVVLCTGAHITGWLGA